MHPKPHALTEEDPELSKLIKHVSVTDVCSIVGILRRSILALRNDDDDDDDDDNVSYSRGGLRCSGEWARYTNT
jgi:hypothetical protein